VIKPAAQFLFLLLLVTASPGHSQVRSDSASLWSRIIQLENRIFADFPETFAVANSVLKETEQADCTRCLGRALMMVGKFYWANGQYEEGLKYFRKSIAISQELKDYDTWSKATDLVANTYYYQAYYDSAEYYFQKAYSIAEESGDINGMILILHNTSLMYHRKGDFKRTIEFIFKGEKLKDKFPGSEHHVESLGAMGPLMIDSIYYKEKIKDEIKNLQHYKSISDSMAIYYSYRNLAKSYRQLLDHKRAARYFIKA